MFSLSSVLFLSLFETTKFSLLFLFVVLHRVWFLGYPKIVSRTYALHVCTVIHVCFHKVNFSLSKFRVCIMFSVIIVECHMSNTIPHVIWKPNMVMGQRSLIMVLS